MSPERGLSRRTIVSGKNTSLHLAGPIVELGEHQIRIAGEIALNLRLAVLIVIQAPKAQDERTRELLRELSQANTEDPRKEIWTKV